MKKIAIIGANEFQSDLIIKAKCLGHETHVFSWGGGEIGETLADHFYNISITEKEKILEKCRELKVDGVCSIASDLANITVHWVARKLGLAAHSEECVANTTNKLYMRNTLLQHQQPIPFYFLVNDVKSINVDNISFPLIVKPIDRSGSRGITKVEKLSELTNAVLHSQSVSFTNEVLIEEFIDGREFSVESISENGAHRVLQITEKFTTGSPKYIESAHLAPARLSLEQERKITEVIISALTALGIKFGPSHSEVKLKNNNEVVIIEIGSRMGGDYIGSFLVESSTGVDFVALTIEQALGQSIDLNSISTSKSKFVSSMVYYQITDKNVDISDETGIETVSLDINNNFSGSVSCSNERYSCAKLLVDKISVDHVISLVEQDYDSI